MPATWATLGPSDWDQIHKVANSFKEALSHSSSVELERFLPTQAERVRIGALLELVKIELAFRWENGRGVLLEHYLAKFPELGAAKDLPAALVYEEYRTRHQHGDRPPVDAYRARFPEQFAELERLTREQPVTQLEATDRAGSGGAQGPQLLTAGGFVEFGGGYTLLARIGAGTFGEVWHARSAGGGFEVAIKIIFRSTDHQDVQRELQALEVIRGLRHPFLLSTQSFWFHAERLYIVMELADLSLAQRLNQCERRGLTGIPKAELLSYLRESAEALDYLHSRTVLHRDIKPENILLLQGHIKVADFGLARIQDNLRSVTATTTGTPLYMPPEVWEGHISQHSDQYSLAMSYIHLRLGTRPFPSNNYLEVMRCHLLHTPDLGDLPDAEKQAILRAAAKDPHQRFPSCLEFTRAIEAALGVGHAAVIETAQPAATARPAPPGAPASVAAPPSAAPGEYATLRPPLTDPAVPVRTPGASTAPTTPSPPASTARPGPPPGRRSRLAVAVLGLLLVLLPAAYAAWQWFGEGSGSPPSVAFEVPEPIRVRAGEAVTFALGLTGVNSLGPIRLVCTNLPADIKLEPGEMLIPHEARGVQVRLAAAADAEPRKITLAFEAPGTSATLDVTVLPLATLPRGCTRSADATVVTARNGLRFYSRIHYRLSDGTLIPFLLIRAVREKDPATFYIMQDKVSNGLFGKFARATGVFTAAGLVAALAAPPNAPLRGAVLAMTRDEDRAEWRRGASVDQLVEGQVETKDLGAADANLPVFRVTAVEAHRFARWLGGLLPSALEWDKAAGRFDRTEGGSPPRQGPFRGVWEKIVASEADRGRIGVGRKALGPMRLDKDTLDVSPFGCRHLSGNGKEWTDTLLEPLGRTVSEDADQGFPAGSLVMLRGHTYRASRPLFFDRLDQDPGPEVGARHPQEASPEIGFRVVLHP